MDAGSAPRDLLRRRVRVAEFYRILWKEGIEGHFFEFYDQARETMFKVSWKQLLEMSKLAADDEGQNNAMQSEHWMVRYNRNGHREEIHWKKPDRTVASIVNGFT
jgi:hypothetical protein